MAYRPGNHYVICDICGFRRYASECRMNWKKQFVCSDTCFEEKHPQYKEPAGLHEKQTVSIHRPEGDLIFLSEFYSDGSTSLDGDSYYEDEGSEKYKDSN